MKLAGLLLWCAVAHGAALTYWVQPCAPDRTCRAGDSDLANWAMEAWQAASHGHLTLTPTADQGKARIRVYWASGNSGMYGETHRILVDGEPGAEVFVLPTVVPAGEKDALLRDAIVYLTCLHEIGHALGLEHTAEFPDIMYSFQYGGNIDEYFGRYRRLLTVREDIRKHAGMSAHDRDRLAEVYH
jgi:hypothetical protein